MWGCARYRRWIDAAFVRGLSSRRWRRLRDHADGCAACRARLDRILVASRGLRASSPPGTPSELEVDLLGREILERVDRPRSGRRLVWAGAAAAAAASALVAWVALRPDRSNDLRARGGADHGGPGARVFCVGGENGARRVIAEARAAEPSLPVPTLRCTLTEALQIAYTTPSLEGLTMVAFSRDSDGAVHWYAPRRGSEPAVSIAPDAVGRPLDWSTRLAVKHAPGTYDLAVLFFDRPVVAEAAAAGREHAIQRLRLRLELAEGSP
jgi:hypothetical protein